MMQRLLDLSRTMVTQKVPAGIVTTIAIGLACLSASHVDATEKQLDGQVGAFPAKSPASRPDVPKARVAEFRKKVDPVLKRVCVGCHGSKKQKGKFRVDTLDPNLLKGKDVSWWLEVFDVISNGEMPPEDAEAQLTDSEKVQVVDWLSGEIQVASQVRRSEQGHTSFRRMTRYEYKYALQDLLGLPHDFSRDLPPETSSADGFKNSSEMLQMTAVQFAEYRVQARRALELATVRGERPPPVYYGISMKAASAKVDATYAAFVEKKKKQIKNGVTTLDEALKKQAAKYALKPGSAQFKNLITGHGVRTHWSYGGAKYAWKPTQERPEVPAVLHDVVVIPANQKFIIDLGDGLPDTGNMRVRIRAARVSDEGNHLPTLRMHFGNQPSNDSRLVVKVGGPDVTIAAPTGKPHFYQWDVPLTDIPRNAFRHTHKLGQTPNPGEFLDLRNTSSAPVSLVIDYVEIIAPALDQWPPESHTRIFPHRQEGTNEKAYVREVLSRFMARAWRRPVSEAEVNQKLSLFTKLRPQCEDFQEAMVEVLASVISSPKFLYLVRSVEEGKGAQPISGFELASRLSFFLWSSLPDAELIRLAGQGKLSDAKVLEQQIRRLLSDPRSQRFERHFMRQWLGMEELDFLKFDAKAYGKVDPLLVEAMKQEPVALFAEMLQHNRPVMDFLHSDYALVNDRLAGHYGLPEVFGDQMRKVKLSPKMKRGGLLGQAGLLAMNSNGKDSNPLKRGIWLLENLLNDPPPPPPPAVPEIDLADPEILKLTLKQRMEDHRDDPACYSCHSKIDPWGIAFENFDALGQWREKIGGQPVDAASVLFNKDELHGMKGLKDYLLANRQDQFARAMTHKLAAYALGRPLTFGDRSQVDRITAELRKQGDGLADLVILIVNSDLFQLN
jgi:mono/diheme cytochrome c family protein